MRARHREALALVVAAGAAALVFSLWPSVDLTVAGWFHDADLGFRWASSVPALAIYRGVPWVQHAIVVAGVLALVGCWRRPGFVSLALHRRVLMLFLCGMLGAGLVIDAGLKDHWGRPRPRDVVEFGGMQPFVPPLVPTSACARNCSFPSGHAATGFLCIAWGALGAPHGRRRWAWAGAAAGTLAGTARMAQGAHFLSDIVFSGLVMWAVCIGLRALWIAAIASRRALARMTCEQP
jgi:lipid A 4'-phosphatase